MPDFTQKVDHEASYKSDDLQEESCQRNPVRRRLCEEGEQKTSLITAEKVSVNNAVSHTHTHTGTIPSLICKESVDDS